MSMHGGLDYLAPLCRLGWRRAWREAASGAYVEDWERVKQQSSAILRVIELETTREGEPGPGSSP